jgi:hypothetical protein
VVAAHYLIRLGEQALLYRAADSNRPASRQVAEICLREFREDLLGIEKEIEGLRTDLDDAGYRLPQFGS